MESALGEKSQQKYGELSKEVQGDRWGEVIR